jgi:hypothetical protein
MYIGGQMNHFLSIILLFSFTSVVGQNVSKDSLAEKDPTAIAEFGGAFSRDLKGGGSGFGYDVAVEMTPIEHWLELELGVSPTFGAHSREWDVDLLFKKPWTFSPGVEFMFGVGLVWTHTEEYSLTTNALGGEMAMDFMFWPFAKHRFGWYLEPAYQYAFARGHDQSVGMSAGLLVAIP